MKVALTIAGSDSSGGAGIQADIKTMQAHGVYATSVVTAVTAQNTQHISASFTLPLDLIEAQMDALYSDIHIHAAKTGMLSTAEVIELISHKLQIYHNAKLVVDPVLKSSSGTLLLDPDAITTMKSMLFPLSTLVTPNANEASLLVGYPVTSVEESRKAARQIYELGAQAVLVKGGHLSYEAEAIDVLYDGTSFHHFSADRINTPHTHGTGCTLASAITANMAKEESLHEAVRRAKRYVNEAIRTGFSIGKGAGPLNHFPQTAAE